MQALTQGQYTQDEGRALREALCSAAQVGADQVDAAISKLSSTPAGQEQLQLVLREHLAAGGSIVNQLIAQEISALSQRLTDLEGGCLMVAQRVGDMEVTLSNILKTISQWQAQGPAGLEPYLEEWWKRNVGRTQLIVSTTGFLTKLSSWLKENG